ncbi:GNAT family N-acetyltransferase [Deinococcus maricopensis]|uniref:N-acetyltransferase domain-containing protein n=1 Tax=Deinococcus maricopensis (strain DSM 21211 / LMG 22137 / NRRL B-23946 / LB-34) TaxID=709986 RepID=E8U6I5_DEIML|nr:GNAT family N-acetyltransferase [Deinococcus maricopensis]ADV66674.1 hypothetical protein Deima_1021 [Deinococcus maricopensis DSM 21211]
MTTAGAVDLGGGYTLRPAPLEAYLAVYARHEQDVFQTWSYQWDASVPTLPVPTLTWLVEHEGDVVGWHYARAWDGRTVYMVNTGLLPAHRGRGVYTRMLPPLLDAFRAGGYTLVRSHHHATNNAILIPKLRAGFVIQGLEMDHHGLMAVLMYSFDDAYRAAMSVRAGHARPSGEAARRLGLHPTPQEDTP